MNSPNEQRTEPDPQRDCGNNTAPVKPSEGADVGGGIAAGTEGADVTPPLLKAKKAFSNWLEIPDDSVLDFVFGVVFANRLSGDPVWGGIVGASGDTKTEILRSLERDDIFPLSNLTAKTLISGLPNAMNGGQETSLLPKLNGKILVVKDLTPLISGNRETRSQVLGQLRDAYDGSAVMAFGTGEVKRYESRFGMLFGVTPVIESCWPIINSLGERFLYYRCANGNSLAKVQTALKNSNNKEQMRLELREAAKEVLDQDVHGDIDVPGPFQTRIVHLADFVATARSPVKRDGRTEEVSYAPVAEVGTRLGGQLIQLARGIAAARGGKTCDDAVMRIVLRVAVSGIPQIRWRIVEALSGECGLKSSGELGQQLRIGSGTVNRNCEDLWSLGLLNREKGPRNLHCWKLTDQTRERLVESGLLDGGQAAQGTPPDICTLTPGIKNGDGSP